MLVVCPNCESAYLVRAKEIGPKGRLMRCGNCRQTFQMAGSADSTDNDAAFQEEEQKDVIIKAAPAQVKPVRRGRMTAIATLTAGIAGLTAIVSTGAVQLDGLITRAEGFFGTILPGISTPKLSFVDLKTSFEGEGPERALVIEGMIVSDSRGPYPLPSMSFEIRGSNDANAANGSIFRWMIPPPAPIIAQGSPVPFRARLASPPREGKDIVIRLVGA